MPGCSRLSECSLDSPLRSAGSFHLRNSRVSPMPIPVIRSHKWYITRARSLVCTIRPSAERHLYHAMLNVHKPCVSHETGQAERCSRIFDALERLNVLATPLAKRMGIGEGAVVRLTHVVALDHLDPASRLQDPSSSLVETTSKQTPHVIGV